MSDRCTGHCCRKFTLPKTPAELRDLGERARLNCHKGLGNENDLDLIMIASMATLIGTEDAADTARGWAKPGEKVNSVSGTVYWYACRNLLPNGDCGVYSFRPKMCREYPYGQACLYKACAWTAAKEAGCGTPNRFWHPREWADVAHVIEEGNAWR